MKNKYLAVLANCDDNPRIQIIRLHKGETPEGVADALGFDLDKCEWMAGDFDISMCI